MSRCQLKHFCQTSEGWGRPFNFKAILATCRMLLVKIPTTLFQSDLFNVWYALVPGQNDIRTILYGPIVYRSRILRISQISVCSPNFSSLFKIWERTVMYSWAGCLYGTIAPYTRLWGWAAYVVECWAEFPPAPKQAEQVGPMWGQWLLNLYILLIVQESVLDTSLLPPLCTM